MDEDGITLECGEDGIWRKKEEPYATIELYSKEELDRLQDRLTLYDRFIKADLSYLEYISDVTPNYTKCDRDGIDEVTINYKILDTITRIQDLQDSFKDKEENYG